jgi:WD40 repeat protein
MEPAGFALAGGVEAPLFHGKTGLRLCSEGQTGMLCWLRAPLRLGAPILLLACVLAFGPARSASFSEFFFGYSKAVNAVALSPNGRHAASGGEDNLLRLWDLPTGLLLRTFEAPTSAIGAVAFSPDGLRILTANNDSRLRVWDIAAGRPATVMEGHTGEVLAAVFSENGQQVLSGGKDKTVKLWDAATGQLLKSFDGCAEDVLGVAISRDGKLALAGSKDKTLKLWDIETGQLLRTFEGHADAVTAVAFSPDAQKALSASRDKTLKLWDVATAKPLKTLEGHTDEVLSAAFAPGGRQILSAAKDKTLKLWDAEAGKLIRTFEGHGEAVASAVFSSDGRLALSGAKDKTLRLWDVAAGQQRAAFDLQADGFAPNGRRTFGFFGFIPGVALPNAPDTAHIKERLQEKGFKLGDPVYLRAFKGDSEVEAWIKRGQRFELFGTYAICAWSGQLGPKVIEGDFQSPEGFYTIGKGQLNPNSHYHRAFNLGYPNAFDATNGRTGSALMMHGSCASAGCYAMTDPVIDELWALVTAALNAGQERVAMHAFPFRMTKERMDAYAWHPAAEFWGDLKVAYDLFEETHVPPQAGVCNKRYTVKRGNGAASAAVTTCTGGGGAQSGWRASTGPARNPAP